MKDQQLKYIAKLAWQKLPAPVRPATPVDIAAAVARSTFELRGNNSEVHLSEGELNAVIAIGCAMLQKEAGWR